MVQSKNLFVTRDNMIFRGFTYPVNSFDSTVLNASLHSELLSVQTTKDSSGCLGRIIMTSFIAVISPNSKAPNTKTLPLIVLQLIK